MATFFINKIMISFFRESPISLITSLSFAEGSISNPLHLRMRRTLGTFSVLWHFRSLNSVRQFQLSNKQKRAVLRRWKHMKTENTTEKNIPKKEQENTQTAITMVSETVQIAELCQRKDAPTIFLSCVYYRSVNNEISGLKPLGFTAFCRSWRHHDV